MLLNTAQGTRWFLVVALALPGYGQVASAGESDQLPGATAELTQVAGDRKARAIAVVQAFWTDLAARIGAQVSCHTHQASILLDAQIEEYGVLAANWVAQDTRMVPDRSEVSSLASWYAGRLRPYVGNIALPSTVVLTLGDQLISLNTLSTVERGSVTFDTWAALIAVETSTPVSVSVPSSRSCSGYTSWEAGPLEFRNSWGVVVARVYWEGSLSVLVSPQVIEYPGGIGASEVNMHMNAWCEDGILWGCAANGITPYQVPGYREGGWEDYICPAGGFFDTPLGLTHAHFFGPPLPTTDMHLDFFDGRSDDSGSSCWDLGLEYQGISIGYEACANWDYSDLCYVILEALEADAEGIWAISVVDIPYCQSGPRGTYTQGGFIRVNGAIEEGTLPGEVGVLEALGHIVISFSSLFAGSHESLDGAEIYVCDDYTRQPLCGNGVCDLDSDENPCNCPQDCDGCCYHSDCSDDGNPCTDPRCVDYICVNVNNDDPCDDGVFCNGYDYCAGGSCQHDGNPCIDSDGNPCNDTCNEALDNCCGSDTTGCQDDGNPCTDDHCDGQCSCVHPPVPDYTSCPGGHCEDGFCVQDDPDINCEELDGHYFGNIAVDEESTEHIWEIINTGQDTLQGVGQGITRYAGDVSDFVITRGEGQSCFPLAPGESCTLGVKFTPHSEWHKECTLRISSNDHDENPCDLELSGDTGHDADWGNCSDENVTIDEDTELEGDMNYRNLTVLSGVTLDTQGHTVRVCETLENHGVITDNFSGGEGGDGGLGGLGDNPWDNQVPEDCGDRDDEGSCDTGQDGLPDGLGEDGEPGCPSANYPDKAGYGGQGGGGGGGGGGSWHSLTETDADGGNGGEGGKGGKGGGYVKVFAYRLDNQGVIHADGFPGEDGGDAPDGDSTDPDGYENCGAEYIEFQFFGPKDLAGGGGGGGGGGAGGEGGTVVCVYHELVNENEGAIHANGGAAGGNGEGGSSGGCCVHEPLLGGANYPCPTGFCGCDGGEPNGGRGGGAGYNGEGGGTELCGEVGALSDDAEDGEQGDIPECSVDADCDDGLHCNGDEYCVDENVCEAGTPPDCSDGLACTVDWCYESADECRHDLEPGYCLIDDQCYFPGTPNPSNECEECKPSESTLDWSPRPADVACGDAGHTACTDPDTCDGDGVCQPNHKPDDTPCDDSLFCNGSEVCITGECEPGEPPLCDDGIPCTEDFCDAFSDACASVPNDDLCPGAGLFCDAEICDPNNPTADSNGCTRLRPPCVLGEVCDEDTDSCLPDCNLNGVPDAEDISEGTSQDCNTNGIPDECDLAQGSSEDCQPNGVPDECELTDNDCNGNMIPDECDLDCNTNGLPDECEVIVIGDSDGDGDRDLDDFVVLAFAMAGPDVPPNVSVPECLGTYLAAFDFDDDGDVDLYDVAGFQTIFAITLPTGACCIDGECTATTAQAQCLPPGLWYEDETCPEYDCMLGACCIGIECTATTTQAECDALSGLWYEGGTCPEYDCTLGACCMDDECTATTTQAQCPPPGLWYEGESCPEFNCAYVYGACCNPCTGDCSWELVTNCLEPSVFTPDVQCVDLIPECAIINGACCIDYQCAYTLCEYDCLALDGAWYEGETCPSYECPPDPCGDTGPGGITLYAQLDSGNTAVICDAGAGHTCRDNFPHGGVLEGLHWFGIERFYDGSTWIDCDNWPATFEITFYGMDCVGGVDLTNVLCGPFIFNSLLGEVTRINTGRELSGSTIWRYDIEAMPEPLCDIWEGWLDIQAIDVGDNCWFLWHNSIDGDNYSLQDGDPYYYDLSMCLTGWYEPAYGPCCDDSSGDCTDGVERQDCPDGLRFVAPTPESPWPLCYNLDPPCGEATGACCLPDGSCVQMADEAECYDEHEGEYLGHFCPCSMCPGVLP